MNRVLGLAALGTTFAAAADGKLLRWSPDDNVRRWTPARETLGVLPLLNQGPQPTEPPRLAQRQLEKKSKDRNTCAYVNGDAATDDCVYNSKNFFIGCCPETSTKCPIWTTCYDRTDSDQFTTDNGYTLLCDQSSYPRCVRHVYQDKSFSGYTLWGCALKGGSDSVYYTPTDSGAGASLTNVLSDPFDSGTSTPDQGTTTVIGSSPTEIPHPSSTDRSSSSESGADDDSAIPVGPVVGGVVGGVAVLLLAAVAIFFMIRASKKNKDNTQIAGAPGTPGAPPPPPPPVTDYQAQPPPPPPSQMAQQEYYAPTIPGYPPADASVAKPPFLSPGPSPYDNGVSPPRSPAPTYQSVSTPSVSYFQPNPDSPAYTVSPHQSYQSPPETDYSNAPSSPSSQPNVILPYNYQPPVSGHPTQPDSSHP